MPNDYLGHVAALIGTRIDAERRLDGGVTTFVIADETELAEVHDPGVDGRVSLRCPAPYGVPQEMADAEPQRFFVPADGRVDAWLGVHLDGTGDDAVDWDEVASIIDDAVRCAAPGTVSRAEPAHDGAFHFDAELWVHHGDGAWHFVTVPSGVARAIDDMVGDLRRGFGSVRVRVTVGGSTWATSIFPDTKRNSYVLPVKKAVRTKERVAQGDTVEVLLAVAEA